MDNIVAYVDDALPRVPLDDVSGWAEQNRSVDAISIALVKLDPVLADLTYEDFQELLFSSPTPNVEYLIEVYDLPKDPGSLYRVSGNRVSDAPRYYRDSLSGVLVLHGMFSQDNIVTALYDPGLFEDSATRYLDASRLFDYETRENRAEEIRNHNSVIDTIQSVDIDEFIEGIEHDTDRATDMYRGYDTGEGDQ